MYSQIISAVNQLKFVEMEETLVALIPLNDDRLKPKRTWFWVLIGIAVCALFSFFRRF